LIANWTRTVREMVREKEREQEEPVNVRLGAALERALVRSGKPKAEVARLLATDAGTINRYLRGERSASVEWVEKFAEACETDSQTILEDAGIIRMLGDIIEKIMQDPLTDPDLRELVVVALRHARAMTERRRNELGTAL
jgi:hypothetical protein